MKEEGSGGGGCGGRGGGRGFGGLIPFSWPWAPFLESPDYFSGPKTCSMLVLFAFKIYVSIILKLSLNEAKLAGLWARNCATIQQVSISKFAFGPETLPGLSRNGPWKREIIREGFY